MSVATSFIQNTSCAPEAASETPWALAIRSSSKPSSGAVPQGQIASSSIVTTLVPCSRQSWKCPSIVLR